MDAQSTPAVAPKRLGLLTWLLTGLLVVVVWSYVGWMYLSRGIPEGSTSSAVVVLIGSAVPLVVCLIVNENQK